jgi:hypothetical protein
MPGWSGWSSLNGGYGGDIEALGQNADGRLEILGLGPAAGGREVTHNWQTMPNSGWNAWASLGSPPQNDVLANVSVARNADGRLGTFVRYGAMSVGTLWQAQQTAPNGGWTGWVSLNIGVGHVTTGPCQVITNADGRLELFAIGSPGGVTHAWQTAPNGGWSTQADLGSPGGVFITNVRLGRHVDGRLAAFSSGSDGAVWQISQTAANNGWGSWSSLGKPAADSVNMMVVGTNADGRLEIFASGSQGMWHAWQTAPNGTWSGWANLGFPGSATGLSGAAVASNADGRLEVFATVFNGDLWHIWQLAPNSGWSGWSTLGGEPYADVMVGNNQDGRLEAFVQGRSAGPPPTAVGVWHRWQTTPGGAWS